MWFWGELMRDDLLRWCSRGALLAVLIAAAVVLAGPASASAAGLYVGLGDSVAAGDGASAGHSFFDLYCAYLESSAGGSRVDQCVNEAQPGATTQSALDGGMVQQAVNDILASTDTPIVTVVLGGNDGLGSPGCQPITGAGCEFIANMRIILDQLETALASRPGPHVIQWLEYYNPNHDNPFGNESADNATAAALLGNDFALTDCSSYDLSLIGLNDAINCVANEKGATPVDAYAPFQSDCTSSDYCFSDALHPNDKGYGLIFDALRQTPGTSVPSTPPPDGSWPFAPGPPANIGRPTVSGIPAPGSTLYCSPGSWAGTRPLSFAYQWLRDSSAIAGQTAPSYLVQSSDPGHALSCRVTASNADGASAAASNPLAVTSPPAAVRIYAVSETKRVLAPSTPHHRGGTVFSFGLSQPAQVTIAIGRRARGRRVGRSCRRPVARLRRHPRCTRTIPTIVLAEHGHAGRNKIAFSGHVRGHALQPGRYIAVFSATAGAPGPATEHTLRFRLIRR